MIAVPRKEGVKRLHTSPFVLPGTSSSSCPPAGHIPLLIPEQSAELFVNSSVREFSHAKLYETRGWRSDSRVIVAPQNCFRHGLCDSHRPCTCLPAACRVPTAGAETPSRDDKALPSRLGFPCLPGDHPSEDHPQLRQWERGMQGRDVRSHKATETASPYK